VLKLKNKNLILVVVYACIFLILASLIPPLRKPFLSALKFPLVVFNVFRRETGGIIFYHKNMALVQRLGKQTGLLRYRINSLTEASLENERLRKLLSLKEKAQFKVLAAGVIGRGADNWNSSVIINKGSDYGINNGMTVINYLGLVGKVAMAGNRESAVMLLDDANFAVSAIVQRSRQEGLVSGTMGNALLMRYLPKDADIRASDIIVTSGLSGFYPKGLLIGEVIDVGEEFSGLSKFALIKPAADLSALEEVLIIVR